MKKMPFDERVIYFANSLQNSLEEQEIQTVVFTSSRSDYEKQKEILSLVVKELQTRFGKKVLFYDTSSGFAKKEENTADYVFFAVPCVQNKFDYLNLAKQADGVFLLESYTKTTHKNFDETLELLRQNNVNVCGVLTY